MTQTDTPVTDLRAQIDQMEEAYEFLISFAGRGIGRESVQSDTGKVGEYVAEFETGVADGFAAARAVPEVHDEFDTAAYRSFLDTMEGEVEEARTVVDLLAEQEVITSALVDNMNGMSVFQSVMMKFFFLDELTDHLERGDA